MPCSKSTNVSSAPERLLDLRTGDDLSRAAGQEDQELRGLRLELDVAAAPPQEAPCGSPAQSFRRRGGVPPASKVIVAAILRADATPADRSTWRTHQNSPAAHLPLLHPGGQALPIVRLNKGGAMHSRRVRLGRHRIGGLRDRERSRGRPRASGRNAPSTRFCCLPPESMIRHSYKRPWTNAPRRPVSVLDQADGGDLPHVPARRHPAPRGPPRRGNASDRPRGPHGQTPVERGLGPLSHHPRQPVARNPDLRRQRRCGLGPLGRLPGLAPGAGIRPDRVGRRVPRQRLLHVPSSSSGKSRTGESRGSTRKRGPGPRSATTSWPPSPSSPSVLKEPRQATPSGPLLLQADSRQPQGRRTPLAMPSSTCVGTFGAADADVEVAHNDHAQWRLRLVHGARDGARPAWSSPGNVARNMAFGAVFATHESRSSRGPTRLRIANNDIEVPDPIDGLFLADFSASPALDLQVLDNRFETTGTRFGAMYVLQVANATVSRNTIAGASGYGIYLAGSGGDIQGNRLRGAAVGIWLDGSSRTAVSGNRVDGERHLGDSPSERLFPQQRLQKQHQRQRPVRSAGGTRRARAIAGPAIAVEPRIPQRSASRRNESWSRSARSEVRPFPHHREEGHVASRAATARAYCEMGIDVRQYAMANQNVARRLRGLRHVRPRLSRGGC